MTAPRSAPADATEADSLVSTLETLQVEEVVAASPTNLADFGLDSPKTTVAVLLEGAGEPQKLLLGDKAPDGSSLYAKLPSQPRVFTIPAYLESTFGKKPFDLRDRDVLHVKRDAVKTLEVSGPEGSYALARDDKGEWTFTRPLATKAGRWSVEGLLGTLESLRMESVASEDAKDLAPFGLAKPARTVVVGLSDGTKKTLEIGVSPSEKKHNARDASTRLVAVIPGAIVDDLAKGMKELRAKRLLEVATYEVEGFDVVEGGVTKVYARSTIKDKDDVPIYKWKRTTPEAKELETNKVQDALFKVGGLEAEEFVDAPGPPERYGFDSPVLKVTIRYGAGKPPAWFEVGRKDGAAYARRPDDQTVLKLDTSKAEDLVKAFKEL